MKRGFDTLLALSGLLLLSPGLALLAALIKLGSPGPVFYRGKRVGRYGRTFRIFKFRTMVADAEKRGGPSTADGDPRVTRIGSFLRKYKLDELPQLINVLSGDMSLVGPRPEVQYYVDMFNDREKAILSVRPGMTDWASLWNSDEGAILAGSSDPEETYIKKIRPEKIRLQLEYVSRRSLWIDLAIILQTLATIVFKIRPKALDAIDGKE